MTLASRVARVGAVLAIMDIGHAVLRAPGALAPADLAGLATLYLLVAIVLVGLMAPLRRAPRAQGALAAALGCGGLGAEMALQRLASPVATTALAIVSAAGGGACMLLASHWPRAGRTVLATAVALVAVLAVWHPITGVPLAAHRPTSDAAPNVVLVVLDTVRADHLGAYGYARDTSPTFDRLATEGMLFERAIAQAPSTKPSTASLLTGTYPSTHGANRDAARVSEEARTLAEHLGAAGYATRLWSSNPWVTPVFGFAQGYDATWVAYDEHAVRVTLLPFLLRRLNGFVDGETRAWDRGKQIVQRLTTGRPSNAARDATLIGSVEGALAAGMPEPFHLYLHLIAAHHPYSPPAPFDTRFGPPRGTPPAVMYPRKRYEIGSTGAPMRDDRHRELVANYDGTIRWTDGLLERLVVALRAAGVLDRTILVVTSDHGEEFRDHGNWGHGQSLYDELLHVPLVIRFPPRVPAGKRVSATVMAIDVVPTVLALAGVAHDPLPGRVLVSDEPLADAPAFAEIHYSFEEARTLVADGFKVIDATVRGRPRRWLFALRGDAGEQTDLLGTTASAARHASLAESLAARAAAVARAARARRTPDEKAHVPSTVRDALRELGYLD